MGGIEVGMNVRAVVIDDETQIGDPVALGCEHPLVESLDFEQRVDGGLSATDRNAQSERSVLLVP